MVNARKLFVDADAFVAIHSGTDSNYQRAIEYLTQIKAADYHLITSDPAFGEAITIISQKEGLEKAVTFAESTLNSDLGIIEVDFVLRRKALDIFKKQTSKNSRFTDCVNMAIMNERNLNTIFSFDIQYKQNKFKRFGIDK